MHTEDYTVKTERLQALMRQHAVGGIWLTENANIAWLTGGSRTYIDTSSQQGIASVVITPNQRYLLTTNIEAERLCTEENLADWEIVTEPWYSPGSALRKLTAGRRIAADRQAPDITDVSRDLIKLDRKSTRLNSSHANI